MGEDRILYAIAESCPFDALLVKDMRFAVNALLQLNLKRFRVPQKGLAKYSALDVMKQGLELLYEFSPSEKNYREAMRTMQVYSEGDEEMLRTLKNSFRLIANAVYNAYAGQRHAESLAPEMLFLQGVPFEPNELQQSFRFVGVRPPDISPPTVKNTIFLDEGFQPYNLLLAGKIGPRECQRGREEHWNRIIRNILGRNSGKALIRAGVEHLNPPNSIVNKIVRVASRSSTGKLPGLLKRDGITLKMLQTIQDVNRTFGKD